MEFLGLIFIITAIGVVIWLWGKAKSAAWTKANQAIFSRRQHQEGIAITAKGVTFTSERAPGDLIGTLVEGLALPRGVSSAVLGRLYVASSDVDRLVFESGSKIGRSFRSVLVVKPTPSGGSRGEYTVTNWTESDGVVSDVDQMKILERRIREELTAFDSSTLFASSRSPAGG